MISVRRRRARADSAPPSSEVVRYWDAVAAQAQRPQAGLVDRYGRPRARRCLLRLLLEVERLSQRPMRFLTGHFVAATAIRG